MLTEDQKKAIVQMAHQFGDLDDSDARFAVETLAGMLSDSDREIILDAQPKPIRQAAKDRWTDLE